MVDIATAEEFLAQRRLAVVGASDRSGNFGRTVYRELRDRGYDVVAVNPTAETVAGDPCVADLEAVTGPVDGAVVMVPAAAAADVVRACVARGIPRVWLFRGLGGSGSVSDEAVDLCRTHGITVIDGACPMMFFETTGWFHRLHRRMRLRNGSLTPTP